MAAAGFKRLGLAFGALLVLLVAGIAGVTFTISPDAARDAVRSEVRALTGLDPSLDGGTTLSLFPQGFIGFTDVRFASQDGGAPALTADRLDARLRWLPLLLGRVEIADVTLVAPVVRIDIADNGRSNWSVLTEKLRNVKMPRLAAFSEIKIDRGTIIVADKPRGITETLNDVELSLAWPSISKSFGASGRVTWRNQKIDVNATLSDLAAALEGARSGLKIRLSGKPLKLAFDGAFSTSPSLRVSGQIAADTPSLRDTTWWIAERPLPGRGGFGRFALKAQADLAGGTVSLGKLNLELDGNAAEGALTFVTDGRQTLQGTLASEKLDLTPYLSAVKLLTADQREWDSQPIDLSALAGFDVDLRLSAAQVALTSAKLKRTAVAANLRSGNLLVTVGESEGFGGTIKGSFALASVAPPNGKDTPGHTAPANTTLKAQLQFDDVDLESCLGEMVGLRRIEGKGRISVDLTGEGPNVLALTRTLNGSVSLSGRQGALAGINVEQLLRRLERRPLSAGAELRSGHTPYDSIAVNLKVAQGVVSVDHVAIEGSAVKLAVAGTASIPSRDLDLRGHAALISSTTGAAAFELPFVVQGPWGDPLVLPDAQILIQRSGAAAPLLNAVRGREAIRSAIERLTGGSVTSQAPPAPAASTQ